MKKEKQIIAHIETIIEDLLCGECGFWACPGAYHANGKLRHHYIGMVTCSRCNGISGANNLYKIITGKYYTPENRMTRTA